MYVVGTCNSLQPKHPLSTAGPSSFWKLTLPLTLAGSLLQMLLCSQVTFVPIRSQTQGAEPDSNQQRKHGLEIGSSGGDFGVWL